jgi:hypothetical protein
LPVSRCADETCRYDGIDLITLIRDWDMIP